MMLPAVHLDEDYFDIKQVDRRLSRIYITDHTLFCDVGGAGGNDAFNNTLAGANGVCIDIDSVVLKKGKEKAKELHVSNRLSFIKASATNLPFPENTFDLVTSFSVIDHIPPKAQAYRAISEFARVIFPNGHVVVTVPNKLFLLGTFMMQIKMNIQKDTFFEQRFTPKEVARCCKKNNLQIIKYDSKYPLRVGKTILTHNVPAIIGRLPSDLLGPLIQVGVNLFSWMEKNGFIFLGARYGVDAIKVR